MERRVFTQEEKMAILDQWSTPPIDRIIKQLEELVRIALEAEKHEVTRPIPFVEIMKDLALIRKAVDTISADQESLDELLKQLRQTNPNVVPTITHTKAELQQIEKLKELQSMCEAARERLHEQLVQHPEAEQAMKEAVEESSSPKKKAKQRQKKFRAMGGDKKWIKS